MFTVKHGLSRTRLNEAKGYAHLIADTVAEIEQMWRLSENGVVPDDIAQVSIDAYRQDIEDALKSLANRIEYKPAPPHHRGYKGQ